MKDKDAINWKILAPHEREGETADALLLRLHYSEDIPDEVRAEARKAGQYFAAACGAINKPEARRRIKEAFDALRADGRRVSEHVADAEGFELAGGDGAAQEADLNDGPKTGYTEAEGAEAIDMVEEQLRNEKRERKRREKQAKARRDAGFEFDEADGRDVYAAYEAWAGDRIDRRTAETLTGPCPNCGGKNRFECGTKDGRRLIVCRQCKPGRRNPDAFKRIMEVLGFGARAAQAVPVPVQAQEGRFPLEGIRGPDMEGLRHICKNWTIGLRWNKRTRQIEISRWKGDRYRQITPLIRDTLIEHIRTRCTNAKGKDVRFNSRTDFVRAARALAGEKQIDPILARIESLPEWDKKPRLDSFLDKMFGAGTDHLTVWASRYIFVGVIQRARRPGCELQEIPLLVGPQGVGKTTHLQGAVPTGERHETWVKQGLHFDPDPKKMHYQVKRAAIVEWAETRGVKYLDLEALKSWLTTSFDTVDEKFEDALEYPRRFIVVGTANPDDGNLPNDDGGNRRYVVVSCPERIEGAKEWLRKNRDQLWAEALYRFNDPAEKLRANLPDALAEAQAARNEEYRETDPIEESLALELERKGGEPFQLTEAAEWAGLARTDKDGAEIPLDMKTKKRLGRALRNLGYENKRRRGEATRWVRTPYAHRTHTVRTPSDDSSNSMPYNDVHPAHPTCPF